MGTRAYNGRCSDTMTSPNNNWLFHLEDGTIHPYCTLQFLPFISIGVNRLCISIVFVLDCRGLLDQKSHTFKAGYVMQKSKCIRLQIMHYGKIVLT